jgi:hypothetical protein
MLYEIMKIKDVMHRVSKDFRPGTDAQFGRLYRQPQKPNIVSQKN